MRIRPSKFITVVVRNDGGPGHLLRRMDGLLQI